MVSWIILFVSFMWYSELVETQAISPLDFACKMLQEYWERIRQCLYVLQMPPPPPPPQLPPPCYTQTPYPNVTQSTTFLQTTVSTSKVTGKSTASTQTTTSSTLSTAVTKLIFSGQTFSTASTETTTVSNFSTSVTQLSTSDKTFSTTATETTTASNLSTTATEQPTTVKTFSTVPTETNTARYISTKATQLSPITKQQRTTSGKVYSITTKPQYTSFPLPSPTAALPTKRPSSTASSTPLSRKFTSKRGTIRRTLSTINTTPTYSRFSKSGVLTGQKVITKAPEKTSRPTRTFFSTRKRIFIQRITKATTRRKSLKNTYSSKDDDSDLDEKEEEDEMNVEDYHEDWDYN